jgi:hypothetical protein
MDSAGAPKKGVRLSLPTTGSLEASFASDLAHLHISKSQGRHGAEELQAEECCRDWNSPLEVRQGTNIEAQERIRKMELP